MSHFPSSIFSLACSGALQASTHAHGRAGMASPNVSPALRAGTCFNSGTKNEQQKLSCPPSRQAIAVFFLLSPSPHYTRSPIFSLSGLPHASHRGGGGKSAFLLSCLVGILIPLFFGGVEVTTSIVIHHRQNGGKLINYEGAPTSGEKARLKIYIGTTRAR